MKKKAFLSPAELKGLQEAEAASSKEQKRTTEQLEAIYAWGQNILVSASAGSGKTFVMVQRIIDKILRGVSIGELFISTFTVKAAGELKERLEKELTKLLKESREHDLRQHLSQQLAELANADIGTMDSFTQKLVQKYGYLLGIAPNFRILQASSEETLLKNEVFSQLFDRYYQGPEAPLFKKLVYNFTAKGRDVTGFRDQVYRIYGFLQSTSDPKAWLEGTFLLGNQELDFDQFDQDLLAKSQQALFDLENFIKQHLDNDGPLFGKAKYLDNLADLLEDLQGLELGASKAETLRVLDLVLAKSKGVALSNLSRKADLSEIKEAYNETRKELIEEIRASKAGLYRLAYQTRYHEEAQPILELLQTFMADFAQAYLERKKEEGAFEFSDISHFAIELLENYPEVRSFYQDKYHEVMVDEYQDTNHTQERMLELLSRANNRFMVGDIKQSIYRFRQADPQIFNDKFKLYQANPQAGRLILLKENFRSHQAVLDVTNAIFKRLMDESLGEIDYNESHYLLAGSQGQRISCPQNQAEFLIYDDSQRGEEAEEQAALSSGQIAMVIKEIIRLHQEEQVPFKDITLLAASRTRNDVILQEFAKHGIPLVTDGGEDNYLQAVEVMVMLDTLRTINNPLNDYALVALLKSAMFDFKEDDLARLALQGAGDQQNFYQKIQLAIKGQGAAPQLLTSDLLAKVQRFEEHLQTWRTYAKTHSLYDLIWKIYNDRFYYDYVGALPNGANRQANLYALALRANDFEKASFKGLARFINMIDKILQAEYDLASVHLAPPKDAVQLMTVHKSKGLEFKYVFLLNLDKTFNKQDSSSPLILSRKMGIGIKYLAQVQTDQPEPGQLKKVQLSIDSLPYQRNQEELQRAHLSEQMRLLYVAMTRAEKKLYLIGKGQEEKLTDKYSQKSQKGRLTLAERQHLNSFQDWILAIEAAFSEENLAFTICYQTDQDLTPEKIGQLQEPLPALGESLKDNRQSQDIARALDILESVDRINQTYQAAINLPTVRTPSQLKELYEPLMETQGVDVMLRPRPGQLDFSLPDFSKKKQASPAQIGSALHELMQRLPLLSPMTLEQIEESLDKVGAEPAVKQALNLDKVLAFFETDLGRLILEKRDCLSREAPFAMLKEDSESGQEFVIRGIIDGYIKLEDRLVLFDYKTDKYKDPGQMRDRYRQQMDLYAEALRRSYGLDRVDKYLILLGGSQVQVLRLDD
ncbi:helicase-exonuclease AddAB subunit AddA [Streptococcus oricebi]|uniref:ATP-dependent helicase/nuclease subunit A n=1 Tax=Streptococcus oricebi TaxID=1547447 RepID=A0ABS5B178_9STRE|nr:helicase-exonuclease AddAB subunit AddA [Streptococcus oricebi]MBP2622584.1 helicase-exonuclease AddAB subunit AddA [Streptococcus oricebi]